MSRLVTVSLAACCLGGQNTVLYNFSVMAEAHRLDSNDLISTFTSYILDFTDINFMYCLQDKYLDTGRTIHFADKKKLFFHCKTVN